MVKHTQTIRRQKATNCLSVFDHFVGLALKGLTMCPFLVKITIFDLLSNPFQTNILFAYLRSEYGIAVKHGPKMG